MGGPAGASFARIARPVTTQLAARLVRGLWAGDGANGVGVGLCLVSPISLSRAPNQPERSSACPQTDISNPCHAPNRNPALPDGSLAHRLRSRASGSNPLSCTQLPRCCLLGSAAQRLSPSAAQRGSHAAPSGPSPTPPSALQGSRWTSYMLASHPADTALLRHGAAPGLPGAARNAASATLRTHRGPAVHQAAVSRVLRRPLVRANSAAEDVDLEDQVELFMKRQAELESGGGRRWCRCRAATAAFGAGVSHVRAAALVLRPA